MQDGRHIGREKRRGGFTYLELLVVVVILGLITGAMIPVFRGSFNGIKAKSATRNLIATLFFAQDRAVSSGIEHRLCLDPRTNSYWVERFNGYTKKQQKRFTPVQERYGEKHPLPDFLILTDVRAPASGKEKIPRIACYPNGSCDVVQLKLHNLREGARLTLSTTGFSGGIKVAEK